MKGQLVECEDNAAEPPLQSKKSRDQALFAELVSYQEELDQSNCSDERPRAFPTLHPKQGVYPKSQSDSSILSDCSAAVAVALMQPFNTQTRWLPLNMGCLGRSGGKRATAPNVQHVRICALDRIWTCSPAFTAHGASAVLQRCSVEQNEADHTELLRAPGKASSQP